MLFLVKLKVEDESTTYSDWHRFMLAVQSTTIEITEQKNAKKKAKEIFFKN